MDLYISREGKTFTGTAHGLVAARMKPRYATQWRKIGDHPLVLPVPPHIADLPDVDTEGHGWVENYFAPDSGALVVPGDYIVADAKEDGPFNVWSASKFENLYEKAE